LLSAGSFSTVDFPGSTSTLALGINDSGQLVGRFLANPSSNGVAGHGFLLSGGSFTTIDFPGSTLTLAFGINDSGDVVGSYTTTDGNPGFLLSGGRFSTIDFPGSTSTTAFGINDSGQIVGDYTSSDGVEHGFLATLISTTVPEPSTFDLMATTLGLVGMCSWRRRRHPSSHELP
jgi:uncharacterized membrane protein